MAGPRGRRLCRGDSCGGTGSSATTANSPLTQCHEVSVHNSFAVLACDDPDPDPGDGLVAGGTGSAAAGLSGVEVPVQ